MKLDREKVLFVGDAPGWNYVEKSLAVIADMHVAPGSIGEVSIRHDGWCAMLQTNGLQPCNCDPDVEVMQ